jgi:hypothetical protein
MYDPGIGRWLGQDPLGFDAGDPNLYRYSGNAPTNAVDPSGMYPNTSLSRGEIGDIYWEYFNQTSGTMSGWIRSLRPEQRVIATWIVNNPASAQLELGSLLVQRDRAELIQDGFTELRLMPPGRPFSPPIDSLIGLRAIDMQMTMTARYAQHQEDTLDGLVLICDLFGVFGIPIAPLVATGLRIGRSDDPARTALRCVLWAVFTSASQGLANRLISGPPSAPNIIGQIPQRSAGSPRFRVPTNPGASYARSPSDILMPGGNPLGTRIPGQNPNLREEQGGLNAAINLFLDLAISIGARDIVFDRDAWVARGTGANQNDFVTFRQDSSDRSGNRPTVDPNIRGIQRVRKVRF